MNKNLEILCEIATESHTRIQHDFADINPMVGVNQKMRKIGVPSDAMTIDCLKSGKRILMILHDQHPDIIRYQLTFKNTDPGESFEQIAFGELTADELYNWIKSYFKSTTNE
jgi:hypothetical protein